MVNCERESESFVRSLRNFVDQEIKRQGSFLSEEQKAETEFNLIRDLDNLIICLPKKYLKK